MPACAALGCHNHSRNRNLSKGGVSYHRFPQDPIIKAKWIRVCGRRNGKIKWVPNKLSTLCSEHFLKEDFYVKKMGHKFIKPTAVPRRNILIRHCMDGVDADNEPKAVEVAKFTPNEPEIIVIPDDTEPVLSHPVTSQISDTTKDNGGNLMTIEPSTPVVEKKLFSDRNTPEIKKLLRLLQLKETKIKQKDAEINLWQAKNRELEENNAVLEQKIKSIDEKFNMSNKLLIRLENTDSPTDFDSTTFHVKEEPIHME